MRINVKSFDFDGSLFNKNYIKSRSATRLIDSNKKFIEHVANRVREEKMDKVIFMVGSNRQSRRNDVGNSRENKTESCFSALIQLAKEFQKHNPSISHHVDPYLLADTCGGTPLGENFIKALTPTFSRIGYEFSECFYDKSKKTQLYAQLHKLASENPKDEIIFDFYDDRNEILTELKSFYEKNPGLIPKNLRLRLHAYDGNHPKNIANIQGSGVIDDNYQETIIEHRLYDTESFLKNRETKCSVTPTYSKALSCMRISTISKFEALKNSISDQLDAEMKNFIVRNKILDDNHLVRYNALKDLRSTMVAIVDKNINHASPGYDHKAEAICNDELQMAVKACLLSKKLNKYNEIEKAGLRLLNAVSFLSSPIKRLTTGTWFYSTQGKPKETVKDLRPLINRLIPQ
jgi:hypothetical protein